MGCLVALLMVSSASWKKQVVPIKYTQGCRPSGRLGPNKRRECQKRMTQDLQGENLGILSLGYIET